MPFFKPHPVEAHSIKTITAKISGDNATTLWLDILVDGEPIAVIFGTPGQRPYFTTLVSALQNYADAETVRLTCPTLFSPTETL